MAGERVVLDEVLKQHQSGRAPNLSIDDFFEVFSIDQILKDFDLSYENILDGIFDGPNDGGIDWAYVILNGGVVNFSEDTVLPGGDLDIGLHIGQSKNEDSFKETPIDRLKSRLELLLNFDADASALAAVKPELVDFFDNFKKLFLMAAGRFPRLSIHLCYASKGEIPQSPSKLLTLAHGTVKLLGERFAKTPVSFDFVGAKELLELARTVPTETFTLKLSESPVSSSREPGYIGLVKLADFFAFIADQKGQLRQRLFEANVRDYQGTKGSNVDIKQTLENRTNIDFWWLIMGLQSSPQTQMKLLGI